MQRSSQYQGGAMADLLNPTNGYRGNQQACGVKPKNHMNANRNYIRQQSASFRQREDNKLEKLES